MDLALPAPPGAGQVNLEDLGTEAPPVAVGAAQIHVAQELHLDVLEAVAAAVRAAPVAGIEAERAGRVAAHLGGGERGERLADRRQHADVARRVGARRPAERRLVHQHDLVDVLVADDLAVRSGRLGGLALELQQRGIQHVLDQRGLAGAADAGDADQPLQRNRHVDGLQVVSRGAADLEPEGVVVGRLAAAGEVRGSRAARRADRRR